MTTRDTTFKAESNLLISQAQLICLLGISLSTLRRLENRGELPNPIWVSPRRKMYLMADIQNWLVHR